MIAYELWMVAEGMAQPFRAPRRGVQPPAPVQLLEKLFADAEAALWAVDFFKNRQSEAMMRTLRELVRRADPDLREAGFLRAMAIEVVKHVRRLEGSRPAE